MTEQENTCCQSPHYLREDVPVSSLGDLQAEFGVQNSLLSEEIYANIPEESSYICLECSTGSREIYSLNNIKEHSSISGHTCVCMFNRNSVEVRCIRCDTPLHNPKLREIEEYFSKKIIQLKDKIDEEVYDSGNHDNNINNNNHNWIMNSLNEIEEKKDSIQINELPRVHKDDLSGSLIYYYCKSLKEFPQIFIEKATEGALKHVLELDMSYNYLEALPDCISSLENAQQISFKRNKLTDIPKEFYKLTNLKDLNLGKNNFLDSNSILSNLCESLTQLHTINFDFSNLSALPKSITCMKITNLSLISCNFVAFPEEILHLQSLEILNLSNNHIGSIPNEIAGLHCLKELEFTNCNIDKIPNLGDLPLLKSLILEQNFISSFNCNENLYPSLTLLNLTSNDFLELPENLLSLKSIKNILILSNPLDNINDSDLNGIMVSYKEKGVILQLRKSTAMARPSTIIKHNDSIGGLFLGCYPSSINRHVLQKLNVTNIITVSDEMPPAFPGLFEYKLIKLDDDPDSDLSAYFDECYDFIETCRCTNRGVLVHCAMGVSRSATVIIAYIMRKNKLNFESAYQLVLAARDLINPNEGFIEQLKNYEKCLPNVSSTSHKTINNNNNNNNNNNSSNYKRGKKNAGCILI